MTSAPEHGEVPKTKALSTDRSKLEKAAELLIAKNKQILISPEWLVPKFPIQPLQLKGTVKCSRLAELKKFLPDKVLLKVVCWVNRSFDLNLKGPKCKHIDVSYFIRWLGLHFFFCCTAANNLHDFRKHHKAVKRCLKDKGYRMSGLGHTKFTAVINALAPRKSEIMLFCTWLGSAACKSVRKVSQCTIDEFVIGFDPKKTLRRS